MHLIYKVLAEASDELKEISGSTWQKQQKIKSSIERTFENWI